MKEIHDIIEAFDEANRQGKKTALATVVHVEGSSYRRPGARMLVTEDGNLTGAISGGCLEGDALRKAVLVITQGRNKLVIYDTTDEEDARLGIQLGCNGIVSILFEPVDNRNTDNPINVLKTAIANRASTVLITGYSMNDENHYGTVSLASLAMGVNRQLLQAAREALANQKSVHTELVTGTNRQFFFLQYYQPPVSLVIVGAGNDAVPLVAIAKILGWPVTLVDGRSSHATRQRFPDVAKIETGKPEEVINRLSPDERTAIILMTHNYNYDIDMLRLLLQKKTGYLGVLGPASKYKKMLLELEQKGIAISNNALEKIYAPTGLDLGAETAEEIALSITSEILTVIEGKDAIHLRQRGYPIHYHTL